MVAPAFISGNSKSLAAVSEEADLEALLAPLFLPAYRLAFGMLQNREEAEDAVQEAALSAWRRRQTFRAGADARPWFFAIVANQCRSLRRGRWSRLLRLADPVISSQPTADLDADLDLRRALARLGHDDRLVLVLRYYLDRPYDEIAATLRISDQAARSRTQRAVRRLRPYLDKPEELIP
jgi:RNA polymerase sigma-70 factor (ECF subfamily)